MTGPPGNHHGAVQPVLKLFQRPGCLQHQHVSCPVVRHPLIPGIVVAAQEHKALTFARNGGHRHTGPYDAVVHGHIHLSCHSHTFGCYGSHGCFHSLSRLGSHGCSACLNHLNQLQAVLPQYLHIGQIRVQIPVPASRHSPYTAHGVVVMNVLGPYGHNAQCSCPRRFIIERKTDIIGQDNLSLKCPEPFLLFQTVQLALGTHLIPNQFSCKPMGFTAVYSSYCLHGEIRLS